MRVMARSLLLGVLMASGVVAQNPAYVMRGDQIHVDQPSHWRNWVFQNDMVADLRIRIDSTGLFDFTTAGIKPRYLAPLQNYVLSREEFQYLEATVLAQGAVISGYARALSNSQLADNVGDDDPTTYWEPAAADFHDDGMRNWQLEINLGQCVWADSIVVIFPPRDDGGTVTVPLMPALAESYDDLTLVQQLAVDRFSRQVAFAAVVAEETLPGTGDTPRVAAGDTLIAAGSLLPRSMDTLRLLNELGITTVRVQGTADPGDVPKLFAVEASMGRRAGDSSSRNYRFTIVGRGSRIGDQRRFSYPLEPLDRADFDGDGLPDAQGTFVHLVRFTVFESDFDQMELLGEDDEGQAAYEALPAERQGMRAYFRRTEGNFLKQVSAEIYAGLAAEARGPVRYFRRELPRLAEIQVWGPGPNVAYRPDLKAGVAVEDGIGTVRAPLAFDGVYASWSRWPSDPYKAGFSTNGGAVPGRDQIYGTVWVDLGATFWVNRLMTGSLTSHDTSNEGSLFGFYIMASDGTALQPLDLKSPEDFTQLEYGLAWEDMVSEIHIDNWDYRARIMEERFELQRTRFLEFRHVDPRKIYEGTYGATAYINEMQLFGQGYPAELSFTSPAIVLEEGITSENAGAAQKREIVSEIYWDTEAVVHSLDPVTGGHVETADLVSEHPDLRIQIQTRTSDTVDSLITYYEVTGYGTSSEARREVDVETWQGIRDLWAEYLIYAALPDSRQIRLQPHRTGRDDDGDGSIDEDPMDGRDNDGDNIIDEDGLTGDVGGPQQFNRLSITLLKHNRRQDDDGDGPEDEDPINGIDDDGDLLIDEDGTRKSQPRNSYDQVVSPYFAGWSPWSQPYTPTAGQSKAQITSPSPRKFLQMRINILSNDPELTGRITSLRVDLSPPISQEVAGELAIRTASGVQRPVGELTVEAADYATPEGISPVEEQAFSYFLRAAGPDPNVPEVAAGFDQVMLLPPGGARLTGVRLGTVEIAEVPAAQGDAMVKRAVRTTFDDAYARNAAGDLVSAQGVVLPVEQSGDSLLVRFPASLNAGFTDLNNRIVELQFSMQLLRDGAQVLAFIRAAGERVFQRVESEGRDVTELVVSETSVPRLRQAGKLLQGVEVGSAITPNGDGINDELRVRFALLHLREDRPVTIAFYDLAGRAVREEEFLVQSGIQEYSWDGRGQDGKVVSPGIYVCQITLESDDEDTRIARLVSVAY